jgi:hypothetical protein
MVHPAKDVVSFNIRACLIHMSEERRMETTMKHSFLDNYSEGAHPRILAALSETNIVQQTTYGDDAYTL